MEMSASLLRRRLLALALLSAGGLLLEIALTRLLSLLYSYNYVYIVLALALLGLALGAAALQLWPRAARYGAYWPGLAALAALLLRWLLLRGGYGLPLPIVLVLLPYGALGMAVTALFQRMLRYSAELYSADLTGAGLAALAALPLLHLLGPPQAMALAAALMLGSSLLLTVAAQSTWQRSLLWLLVLAAAGQSLWPWPALNLETLPTAKALRQQVRAGGQALRYHWDGLARSDLLYDPLRSRYLLFLDGGAASLVPDASRPEQWREDIAGFPFASHRIDRALLLGSGGGLDIALARAAAVAEIIAVELSPGIVQLTRSLADYTGDIYEGITVHIDDGRVLLPRLETELDLILLSHVISQAAEARAYALSEHSLYTVEAFHSYWQRLSPQGQLALKLYDERTLTRALVTAVAMLQRQGIASDEALAHLLLLLDNRSQPAVPLLLLYKSPLDRDEAVRLARLAEARGLALLMVPHLLLPATLEALQHPEDGLARLIGSSEADISPRYDDRPFFFHFTPGLPEAMQPLAYAALLLSGLLVASLLWTRWRHAPLAGIYAGITASGLGFMALQVVLLQRVRLLLGAPALSLSVVLAALLLLGGLGARITAQAGQPHKRLAAVAVALVGLTLLWWWAWPLLAAQVQAWALPGRMAAALLSISPLALLLGMPFPWLLRRLASSQMALAWTLSGLSNVLASIAATLLALLWGFQAVMLLAVAAYIALAWLAWRS